MCRLFGLSAAPNRVRATFWLLDAADSLAAQSRQEPDGVGLGVFTPDGTPQVHKRPLAAWQDAEFAREAREVQATTFLAHIRFASTGPVELANTHPFCQDGRLFAHNGIIGGLGRLDAELGEDRRLVRGDTDSERLFALITRHIRRAGGDVDAGIATAVRWVAASLPLFSLNLVLTTPDQLWALRYPETHDLLVLQRQAGGPAGDRHLEHASAPGTVRVRSLDLAAAPALVVASERMDEDPGWRSLRSGELLHVGPALQVTSTLLLDRPPAQPLTLADLDPHAAASQQATSSSATGLPPSGPVEQGRCRPSGTGRVSGQGRLKRLQD